MKHLTEKMKDGFVLAVIAAFAGGSTPVFAKIAFEVFHPFTVILLRFVFATLCLLPFVYQKRELSFKFFKELFWVACIGALNPILFFIALPFTAASVSPIIYAGVPAMTAVYFYFFQRQKITKHQLLGIIMGFTGVVLIIVLPMLQKQQSLAAFYGNALIFAAAIAFMFYGIRSKKKQLELHVSPIALTFYFCLVSILISIPLAGHELLVYGFPQLIQLRHILSVMFVGLVGTGLFYIVYQYALKLGSELAAALFSYLQPIATISLAILFLGERVTAPFIIGGVLAVIGARIAAKK